MMQVVLESATVREELRPIPEPVRVYTGEWVPATTYVPTADGEGVRAYRGVVRDTVDGWHSHHCDQARLYGFKPPPHPVTVPPKRERLYVCDVVVSGDTHTVEVAARDFKNDKDALRYVTEYLLKQAWDALNGT